MNFSKVMKLMKNAKKIRKQSKKLTASLKKKKFTSKSPDNLVSVVMTGNKKLVDLKIDKKAMNGKDTDMLSDLILSTINKTSSKIDKFNSKAVKNQFGNVLK